MNNSNAKYSFRSEQKVGRCRIDMFIYGVENRCHQTVGLLQSRTPQNDLVPVRSSWKKSNDRERGGLLQSPYETEFRAFGNIYRKIFFLEFFLFYYLQLCRISSPKLDTYYTCNNIFRRQSENVITSIICVQFG